jgi:mRNA interferase MazF
MMRGEIRWAEFGMPYGSEAGYNRPVLVVQDDAFNESRIRTIIVLPLTTNLHLADAPENVLIRKKEAKLKNDSVVIVAQFYAIDRSRLKEKISKISKGTMEKIEVGMNLVLGIK